jgi:hypothetical protein
MNKIRDLNLIGIMSNMKNGGFPTGVLNLSKNDR